ncbi:hypothetical protein IED13_01120 [Bosea sp. SSUT16]|uniref:Uncharacterized protein n=1 Tax=Bosea spartocytisi TaxID=2773451 RepID=A0A927E6N8_9HYPH|nr:hypothetical protein [Bosea spartocytisi]MBD3844280.1 hypothetical protein [Bosea spartocytisi]MCT4470614.1 hypothetical protein [Bosea spartocytisi]
MAKLTKAQLAALAKWDGKETSIYHAGGVRRDVGKKLLAMGLIEPAEKGFQPNYSICRLTEAGRAALEPRDER